MLASEPDTGEVAEWEVVEEAPLRVDSSAYILKMDGDQVEGFSAIPPDATAFEPMHAAEIADGTDRSPSRLSNT